MKAPDLSVITPVYNEEAVLPQLVERLLGSAEKTGRSFEVVVVNDASTDQTRSLLDALADDARVVPLHLDSNHGQFGATRRGLAHARGKQILAIDGDLQDPPEHIPALVQALPPGASCHAVAFATKDRREDPTWMQMGSAGYHGLQRLLTAQVPAGAGSFCVMHREMAGRVAKLELRWANLAAVLVALGAEPIAVPYDRHGRYDNQSRVGAMGLVKEALGSLALLSAPGRWLLKRRV